MHIMGNGNFKEFPFKTNLFIVLGIVLTFIFFVGALGKVYLFDSSIMYYYGYLISIGYTPFVDFSTPLLPSLAVFQLIAYNIFGYTYFSGIFFAFILVVFEYFVVYKLISNFLNNDKIASIFSFLLSVSAIPFTSNLYYNHVILALISIWFLIMYSEFKNSKLNVYFSFLNAVIISILLLVKIHWGVVVLVIQLFNELMFNRKGVKNVVYKFFTWGGIFISISFLVFYISNNASFYNYSENIKLISTDFSFRTSINFRGLLKLLINLPSNITGGIEISPLSITLILLSPILFSFKKLFGQFKLEFVLILEVVFISFTLIFNSLETQTILLPLNALIILFFFIIFQNFNNLSGVIYIFLFFHILFSFFYVINGNRKLYDELSGTFGEIGIMPKFHLNTGNSTSSPEVNLFFKGIDLTKNQVCAFNYIDSVVTKNKNCSIYFGPELEMFNVIYKVKPIKGFPLWVHPGLTVSNTMYNDLKNKLENSHPKIIFISKKRINFLPFLLDDSFLINNKYQKFGFDNDLSFVACYIRKD